MFKLHHISAVAAKMWSIKAVSCLIFILIPAFQSQSKTYYFSLNKTSNEYMIRNRLDPYNSTVNYHSGIHLSELRNNVTRKRNLSEVHTHPLLDPEWDYNWKNITRPKLPAYINKYYETFSKNITGAVRFLFNTKRQNSTIIKYNISEIGTDENISEVELHFYLKVDKSLLQKSIILRLYQMENYYVNETSLINPDSHKLLNVIYIYQAESGWQIFKLTNALVSFLNNRTDLSLFITISKPNEDQFSIFKDVNRDTQRTFMLLKSESLDNGFLPSDENAMSNNLCRKYDLHVYFEKLNWMKFIISPSEFNAFNCHGACYRSAENLPNHLKVTNFSPEISRKSLCCTSVKYSPLSIMFYDKKGNVVIKVYKDMIIVACGCR